MFDAPKVTRGNHSTKTVQVCNSNIVYIGMHGGIKYK